MLNLQPMGLNVRDATRGDADAVARLLADMGYPTSARMAAAHITRFTDDPASRMKVAEDDADGVVGVLATHIVPRLDADRFTCRITDLVVAATHRRSGIGSSLVAAAEQEARTAGALRIDRASGEWRDDAHAFYESQGFETHARAFTKRLSPG
jgi:GNAT superfamily N-acetyltransferase